MTLARALPRWMPALTLSLLLAACAGPQQQPSPPAAAPVPAAPFKPSADVMAFEKAQAAAAQLAAREGRWVDAVWFWDTVLAVAPQDAQAQQGRQAAQGQIQAQLAETLPAARAARARGQWDEATRLYLETLVLLPGQLEAANALRSIERERAQRQAVGPFARPLLPPDASLSDAQARVATRRLDLEHASMLAGQGDTDAAIALLLPTPTSRPADAASRKLLTELLLKRADQLAANNTEAAIADLRQLLRLQPRHTQARARLKVLLSSQAAAGNAKQSAPRQPVNKPSSRP